MTSMSDLSQDLVEEILSRVPIDSLKALKSTCKLWNALFKDPSFINKHCGKAAKENLVIMMYDFKVSLMSVNLHENNNNKDSVDPSIKQLGKLNQVKISEVFQCNGLLLCVTHEYENSRLVVWNPYTGQTRWIQQPRKGYTSGHIFAMGYDNNKNHKILSIYYRLGHYCYEIYDLKSKSDSWRVLDVTNEPSIYRRSVSLKGNCYFLGTDEEANKYILRCFDFTRETFGQFLPMPSFLEEEELESCFEDEVILSAVREEKLIVFFKKYHRFMPELKIWISNRIDQPNEVSWSRFFDVDIPPEKFHDIYGNFCIDEKKKLVLFCDRYGISWTNHKAYIVGEGGYYREVDLGVTQRQTLMCSSYVPSLVQI